MILNKGSFLLERPLLQFFPQETATASRLGPEERKNLSLQVLAQTKTVCQLAQNHGVSRKFLYQQAAKASDAIDEAFTPSNGRLFVSTNTGRI